MSIFWIIRLNWSSFYCSVSSSAYFWYFLLISEDDGVLGLLLCPLIVGEP